MPLSFLRINLQWFSNQKSATDLHGQLPVAKVECKKHMRPGGVILALPFIAVPSGLSQTSLSLWFFTSTWGGCMESKRDDVCNIALQHTHKHTFGEHFSL